MDDVAKKPLVYRLPGAEVVTVRAEIEYARTDAGALTLDLYEAAGAGPGQRCPAVIFVTGFPDPAMAARVGRKLKDWTSYQSWARLVAASGLVGVTYGNREPEDVFALLGYLRDHAADLGIDQRRIGIWACSGNVPMALAVLMRESPNPFRCAALLYGLTFDTEGFSAVADFWAQFGRTSPCAGKSIDDLPANLPTLLVRAGLDNIPGLNPALDRFVTAALTRNLPMTLVNHASGPHAFDIDDDTEASREIIRGVLRFLQFHLRER